MADDGMRNDNILQHVRSHLGHGSNTNDARKTAMLETTSVTNRVCSSVAPICDTGWVAPICDTGWVAPSHQIQHNVTEHMVQTRHNSIVASRYAAKWLCTCHMSNALALLEGNMWIIMLLGQ